MLASHSGSATGTGRPVRDRGEAESGPGPVDRRDLEVDEPVRKTGSAHVVLCDLGADARCPFGPADPKSVLVGAPCHVTDAGGQLRGRAHEPERYIGSAPRRPSKPYARREVGDREFWRGADEGDRGGFADSELLGKRGPRIAQRRLRLDGTCHGSGQHIAGRPARWRRPGLRRLVNSFLRFDRLEDSLVPLTIVVTRLDDGVEERLTEAPALEAVLASAALPAIFPVVEREGSRYIDGGVVDKTPLSVALAAGARRIYVLLCGGVNSRPIDAGRPYEALLVAFGLSIRARLRRDLATVPADVEVIVLEQSGVEEILWQDFSHTEELLERGYLDARVVLDRVERQIAERGGTRSATRWWSRTNGRPPLRRGKPRADRSS